MGLTLTEKILKNHLVDGDFVKGQEIGIKIDQTLTQDATGTMAYLEFEAMGVPRVKTEKSVAYIDHNTLQTGFDVKFENVNIPLDVLALINGSEVTHTGAAGTEGRTGTQKASVIETESQVPVMFNLEAKSDLINGQAADIHVEMYCVKGILDVKTTADDYWTCSFEGSAFARKKDGAYRELSINETDTAIAE